jgi:hypothetical protein
MTDDPSPLTPEESRRQLAALLAEGSAPLALPTEPSEPFEQGRIWHEHANPQERAMIDFAPLRQREWGQLQPRPAPESPWREVTGCRGHGPRPPARPT